MSFTSLLLAARPGDFELQLVRAGARVCLADLIDVDFSTTGAEVVLSAAVVFDCPNCDTVTQDVYGAAICRGPAEGHETVVVSMTEARGERDFTRRVGPDEPVAGESHGFDRVTGRSLSFRSMMFPPPGVSVEAA